MLIKIVRFYLPLKCTTIVTNTETNISSDISKANDSEFLQKVESENNSNFSTDSNKNQNYDTERPNLLSINEDFQNISGSISFKNENTSNNSLTSKKSGIPIPKRIFKKYSTLESLQSSNESICDREINLLETRSYYSHYVGGIRPADKNFFKKKSKVPIPNRFIKNYSPSCGLLCKTDYSYENYKKHLKKQSSEQNKPSLDSAEEELDTGRSDCLSTVHCFQEKMDELPYKKIRRLSSISYSSSVGDEKFAQDNSNLLNNDFCERSCNIIKCRRKKILITPDQQNFFICLPDNDPKDTEKNPPILQSSMSLSRNISSNNKDSLNATVEDFQTQPTLLHTGCDSNKIIEDEYESTIQNTSNYSDDCMDTNKLEELLMNNISSHSEQETPWIIFVILFILAIVLCFFIVFLLNKIILDT